MISPRAGTQYTVLGSEQNGLLNVSANLVQGQDVAVSGVAAPTSITAGGGAGKTLADGTKVNMVVSSGPPKKKKKHTKK